MAMESRSFETAAFPKLRNEEAIDALRDYIHELEEQKGKELTEKQTKALIRFTRGLISSIETEKQRINSDKELCARWLGENETKENQLRWLRYIFTI
jgi:hypothetical protein